MNHILVVDDDPAILEALQISLELEGHVVLVASDGKTALSIAHERQPKLIVLDVLLSGDDGRDIARELKGTSQTAQIPIVMMSAHPNIEPSVMEAGANHFMPKPFDMDELLGYAKLYNSSQ